MADDLISRADALAAVAENSTVNAIRAIRALPAKQVAVKPLEWKECGDVDGVQEWRAVTILGVYNVCYVMGRTGYMVYGGSISPLSMVFGDDRVAKGAAQVNYESRIRSALA